MQFIWHEPEIEDSHLVPLDDADWDADLAAWQAECDSSRAAAAGKDLGYRGERHGEPVSLRWIYVHMIEQYRGTTAMSTLFVNCWTA
jgi:hypothetical protein